MCVMEYIASQREGIRARHAEAFACGDSREEQPFRDAYEILAEIDALKGLK